MAQGAKLEPSRHGEHAQFKTQAAINKDNKLPQNGNRHLVIISKQSCHNPFSSRRIKAILAQRVFGAAKIKNFVSNANFLTVSIHECSNKSLRALIKEDFNGEFDAQEDIDVALPPHF